MATTSAAEALRTAGRRDQRAAGVRLSELFTRHGATVLGLCRLLLRQREEAEDAVQQTFLAAYSSLLNGIEPRHPAAWLATIARNECRGRIRQRMREPLSEPDPASGSLDPVAAAATRADLQALWQAIGELPGQQREALLLREFSGLSYAELADALGVSKPAVESLLFRARRGLRARLRPAYGSAAGIAPLATIREALSRAIGLPDPVSAGALAKLASAPLVAKLAAGAAVLAVAGGTVAEFEQSSGPEPPTVQPAKPVAVRSAVGGRIQEVARTRVLRRVSVTADRPRPRPVVVRLPRARVAAEPIRRAEPDPVEPLATAVEPEPVLPPAPVVDPTAPAAEDETAAGETQTSVTDSNSGPGGGDVNEGEGSSSSGDDGGSSSGSNEGPGSESSGPSSSGSGSDDLVVESPEPTTTSSSESGEGSAALTVSPNEGSGSGDSGSGGDGGSGDGGASGSNSGPG